MPWCNPDNMPRLSHHGTGMAKHLQGFMTSLRNGRNIVAPVILVNGLDTVKGLSTKLQKRDADVVIAYNLIDTAIEEVGRQRVDFRSVWSSWFTEAETNAADVGGEIAIPRRAKHQIHRANTPADTARYIFDIDLTCIYFYRFNFLGTTSNCYD